MSEDIQFLSEVKRGRQRRLCLKHTLEKPLIVSEIMGAINQNMIEGKNIRLRDVSRSLKWLRDKGAVKCLNPVKQRGERGVLYQLTNKGKKIKSLIV